MYSHSIANLEDVPQIQVLMASSISTLLGELLNDHQLEAAKESMGLDTQLIEDGTYFLVKKEELIGSGVIAIERLYLEDIIHQTDLTIY